LFSDALREYLAHHTPDNITELMDQAPAQIGAGKDTFPYSSARRTLPADRVVISQGENWWADLPEPKGSGPGFRRPVVAVQSDALDQTGIATFVRVPLTSNLKWALAPGNVRLLAHATGRAKDSVAKLYRNFLPWIKSC
jgi:mRNA-degrading endonuclease toxin of MazEF toxin-antitoxin module